MACPGNCPDFIWDKKRGLCRASHCADKVRYYKVEAFGVEECEHIAMCLSLVFAAYKNQILKTREAFFPNEQETNNER